MNLVINDIDAEQLGIVMGDGFLNAISGASPLKAVIENKSRLNHGKEVIVNPKLDERDVTLVFNLSGSTETEFRTRKAAFFTELYKGNVSIKVPPNGNETYHLIYKKQVSYGQNVTRTFCKIAVLFNEPNPNNR